MQSNSVILSIGIIICLTGNVSGEGTNQPPAVGILFQKGTTSSINQLRDAAVSELSKKGATNLGEFNCTVNVSFRPPNVGTFVLFTKGLGQPYHQVRFDHDGRIVQTYSGKATEHLGTTAFPDPRIVKSMKEEGIEN